MLHGKLQLGLGHSKREREKAGEREGRQKARRIERKKMRRMRQETEKEWRIFFFFPEKSDMTS